MFTHIPSRHAYSHLPWESFPGFLTKNILSRRKPSTPPASAARCFRALPVLICVGLLTLALIAAGGCAAKPGKITHNQDRLRGAFVPAGMQGASLEKLFASWDEIKKILPAGALPEGSAVAVDGGVVLFEVTSSSTVIDQPENPADAAGLNVGADGSIEATTPQAHKPAGPPSPVSKAMGWLAIIGGIAGFAGGVLLVMRKSGTPWMAAMPKGMGQGMVVGGFGLMAVCVTFSDKPIYAALAVAAGIGWGIWVAVKDNRAQKAERDRIAAEKVAAEAKKQVITKTLVERDGDKVTKTTTTSASGGLEIMPPMGVQ